MHTGRLLLREDRLLEHPKNQLDSIANAAAMAMIRLFSGRERLLLSSDQIISLQLMEDKFWTKE